VTILAACIEHLEQRGTAEGVTPARSRDRRANQTIENGRKGGMSPAERGAVHTICEAMPWAGSEAAPDLRHQIS
jgi:hypothetical protein